MPPEIAAAVREPEPEVEPVAEAAEPAVQAATPKRKEQSVLFKLGGLQSMAVQSSARQGGGPPEASGLLDIRLLAATIQSHEAETHNVLFVGKAKASIPVALPTSSPGLALGPAKSKGKGGLITAAVVFLVLVVAAGVLVYFVHVGKQKPGAGSESQAGAASSVMDPMDPAMGPAVMDPMDPAMGPSVMDPMDPAMGPAVMDPAMGAAAVDPAMERAMAPEVTKPIRPKKLPSKLLSKHITEGLATVAGKVADCKKDRKGWFKLLITVVGKTGKVNQVQVKGRRQRKSKTGKCLRKLFAKAQFSPFKRRRQSFNHRVRIK